MNIFNSFLTKHRSSFIQEIDKVFAEKKAQIDSKDIHFALENLSEFCKRGKMIRAGLVVLSHDMFKGKNSSEAIRIAVAIELTHAAMLIHDDIMDNDELRRGNPSLYSFYKQYAEANHIKDSLDYGKSIAITLGDYLFYIAKEILATLNIDDKRSRMIQIKFAQVIQNVAFGQFLDYDFGKKSQIPSVKAILEMYSLKTASYSLSLPLILGAYLTGEQEDENIDLLNRFGSNLGTAFQIKDDYIGIFGQEDKTGKPIGSDIRENKKTLIRAFLQNEVNKNDQRILVDIFNKSYINLSDIKIITEMILKYHIDSKILDLINELSHKAKESIDTLKINKEYKDLFYKLIEYNKERLS